MNLFVVASSLFLMGRICELDSQAADTAARRFGEFGITNFSQSQSTNGVGTSVRKIGPQSFVGVTSVSESNRVKVAIGALTDSICVFRVTNREPHDVLVWNVRVQTKSTGPGTDGLGWETVAADYPSGSSHISPEGVGEFRIKRPYLEKWRICVLYSVDIKDEGGRFYGNFEACTPAQEE